jgi:hypothetical protein
MPVLFSTYGSCVEVRKVRLEGLTWIHWEWGYFPPGLKRTLKAPPIASFLRFAIADESAANSEGGSQYALDISLRELHPAWGEYFRSVLSRIM